LNKDFVFFSLPLFVPQYSSMTIISTKSVMERKREDQNFGDMATLDGGALDGDSWFSVIGYLTPPDVVAALQVCLSWHSK
jgi:hypothetical protein